ncbi:predicted protein [Naegleria gruberi]|uniref:Alpha-1,3-glucosyltransferase n=1 Tax=Naegleria gruberi TaxID=5762 RepID=D2VN54_NAEGR|nr:uncharacterized protein NAEGRDRAFT_70375 [Naegleria gruberi]EFC41684.1 predicted protein [Naegleria gruberi]|eukprot:XP_002674428.1 predicted protein [Naegleria gruberi strain NEG-M]
MKHLNLYMAPAYFFFLLFDFCLADGKVTSFIKRIFGLGISVISVFLLSFLPFLLSSSSQFDNKIDGMKSEFQQIMSRLFPFERGLTHAYWAPNFWALYNTLDKLLTVVLGKVLKVVAIDEKTASLTGGLVGLNQGTHTILPSITPLITIILCLGISFSVCFYLIVLSGKTKKKGVQTILLAIVHSVYAFYMFGWHIHEKAVLSILIPLSVLVTCFSSSELSREWFRVFSFTSIVGTFSLFPLLFQTKEIPIRWTVLISFVLFLRHIWYSVPEFNNSGRLFSTFERLFLYGLILIEIYQVLIHQFIFSDRLPFLPLMIVSFYCAVGLHYSWLKIFSISTFSIKEKSN